MELTKSVPHGPAPLDSCPDTSTILLLVMSTGKISSGQSRYMYRLCAIVWRVLGYLVRSTSINLYLVLVHSYSGCIMPPVSHSMIHFTAIHSLPRSTRLWYGLALCFSGSFLQAALR